MIEVTAYDTESGYNVAIDDTLITGCRILGDQVTFKAKITYGPQLPIVGDELDIEQAEEVMEGLPEGTILKGSNGEVAVLVRHDWNQGTMWSVTGREKLFTLDQLKLDVTTVLFIPGKEKS